MLGELIVRSASQRWLQILFVTIATLSPVVAARAQTGPPNIVSCDLDIDDNTGSLVWGNTVHLTGAPGTGTQEGFFRLINGNTPEQDVDHDGYATACDYNAIVAPVNLRTRLVNVANQAFAIPPENVILRNLPHVLRSGEEVNVFVHVEVPPGTPAGVYRGSIDVRDSLKLPTVSTTGQALGTDDILIEVTVTEQRAIGLVNSDTASVLDSLLLRGQAGSTAQGVFRIANLGNVALSDVRISSTDLQSESAVGITIPSQDVTFSAPSFSSVGLTDTARVTVSVNIPRGILGGRYRGALLVQAAGATPVQVPLILIVTSSRGIVFENNPVRNANGVARIAFNGDPGTEYKVGIFDLNGLLVYTTSGTVYAGTTLNGTPGTAQNPAAGADYAVSVVWPLMNGRGESVASGTYLVTAESIVNGQRQLAQDKLMVIR